MVREVLDHWDNTLDHTEDYLYDLVGNRVKKTTDNPNTAGVDSVTTYTYNQNDQAIAEFVDLGGDNIVDETISYTWQGTQQTSKTTTVNSVNVDTVQLVYNLRGQLSRVTTETRNASNQLTKNTQVSYRYDIAGIRNVELSYNDVNLDGSFATTEKSGSISYTINHRSMTGVAEVLIESHRDGDDNLVKRVSYTFAEDELTQTTTEYNPANGQQTSKTTLTFGHDGHGSVRAVFGASAALLQAFTYAAYGELLAVHSTTGQSVAVAQALTRMLYSGEATDPNTGMQYLRARWYDTNSGRFATLDPHGGVFENPLTMNKYAYTSGDPISYNDPTGEFEGLAGMMGSMGNMMANFGMRASQGLRALKTARSLQRFVKLYQKAMNLIEKVENIMDVAESITEFLSGGAQVTAILAEMWDEVQAGMNALLPGGGGAAASSTFSSNTAARSAAASMPLTTGTPYRRDFVLSDKINKAWSSKRERTIEGFKTGKYKTLTGGIKVVTKIVNAIIGKIKTSEIMGEWGASFAMRLMGFSPGKLTLPSVHGIDLLMSHPTHLWAVVEAKGGRSKLGRAHYGYGPNGKSNGISVQQMSGDWIRYTVNQVIRLNQGTPD